MENWRHFVTETQQGRVKVPDQLLGLGDARIYYRAAIYQWSAKNLTKEVQEDQVPHSSYHETAGSVRNAKGQNAQNAIFSADKVYIGQTPNENNAKVLAVKILLNNLDRKLQTYPHSQISQIVKRHIANIRTLASSYKKKYATDELYNLAKRGLALKVNNISQISSNMEIRSSAKRSGEDFKSKQDAMELMLATSYDFIEGIDKLDLSMISRKVQQFHKTAESDWASKKNWKLVGTEDSGTLDRKSVFDK